MIECNLLILGLRVLGSLLKVTSSYPRNLFMPLSQSVHGGLALDHGDPVRQVRRHDEVVLHAEASFPCVEYEPPDDLGSHQSLLAVQVD